MSTHLLDPDVVRAAVGAAALALCAVLVVWWMVDRIRGSRKRPGLRRWAAVLGTGSAVAVAAGAPLMPSPAVTVPVSDLVAPAVAVSVLRRILEVRREQLRNAGEVSFPRRLNDNEHVVLTEIVRQSALHGRQAIGSDPEQFDVPPRIVALLESIQEVDSTDPAALRAPFRDWSLMVRLVGEPVLENRQGDRAVFGKKKSMELLCWMALNRNRSTRSAARTALWDVDIAGSTFSTIVSDMRRTLRKLSADSIEDELSPVTHTDHLPLSHRVVTDVDVIEGSMVSGSLPDLMHGLRLVRDMPFAGTSYLWADLDGSTTRIVMVVLRAVWSAIELANKSGDSATELEAISAGLRVMPGDAELLARQGWLFSTLSHDPI